MAASASPSSDANMAQNSSNLNNNSAPSAALEAIGARPRRAQRRPTKQASYELANHAKAYLEGGQFASGYDFLYTLLAAGTSISTPAQPYMGYLAPPAHIAFASSLIVYPHTTTKSQSKEAIKGSDAALRYVQCVQTTIEGPAYPTIRKAFAFPEERNRRRVISNRNASGSQSPEPGGDIERIAGVAANAENLWHRAEDFWHIVGWSFNCSVAHKKRWGRWKLWLATMLDFLEADWQVCVKQSKTDEATLEAYLQNSLLWYYVIGDAESMNRGMRRRIIKAILATATPESLKEYPEIWEKETTRLKRKENEGQPLRQVDFGTGDVGDYESDDETQRGLDQDVEDDSEDPPKYSSDDFVENVHDATEQLGGQDAIDLRQRLIALLAQAAQALPIQFTPLGDFFDNVLEDFIQLPTIIFDVLLSTLKLPGPLRLAFNNNLLLPLISCSLPDYLRCEPAQAHLESVTFLLRGTTQSFATNAKISLILEQMFMLMMEETALTPTDALRKAIEMGIEARHSVHGIARSKGGHAAREEELAKELMEASSNRLLGLLEVLEISSGKAPQPLAGNNSRANLPGFLSFTSGSSLSTAPDSEMEGGQ